MIKEVECTADKVVSFSTFTSPLDYQNIIYLGPWSMWTSVVRLI